MSEYCEISSSRIDVKKINFEWELIFSDENSGTYRAKVFGGWIINNYIMSVSESMVFVPDENHEWEI